MASSSQEDSSSRTRNYGDGPPWIFTGRALYQLHLVKAEVAHRFIPPELKLVQAFGYTLGGLYLAHYDSSPAGIFDEMVVLAGIVWNPPTSCAWASRVLVNSKEARDHGIKEVGLPSQTADFRLQAHIDEDKQRQPWWKIRTQRASENEASKPLNHKTSFDIVQTNGDIRRPLCHVELLNDSTKGPGWSGPSIHMSLPSFSGKTKQQPELLKYSCSLNCRVRAVVPAQVFSLQSSQEGISENTKDKYGDTEVLSILMGKPLVALGFERMVMHVDAPTVVTLKDTQHDHKVATGKLASWPHHPTSSI
ncbi:unnamed protein product [Sphagnum jensenii]|uniref:Protein NEOXANTHIN-DEFICIENT 1 n=1 Tax=Sphagnum jensenii TaxID=128206 RepID=A0ABP1A275_9BRYO